MTVHAEDKILYKEQLKVKWTTLLYKLLISKIINYTTFMLITINYQKQYFITLYLQNDEDGEIQKVS